MNDHLSLSKKSKLLKKSGKFKSYLTPVLLILLSFTIVVIFKIYPILSAILTSFYEWDGFHAPNFIGLRNFVELFSKDNLFYQSLINTSIFTVLTTIGKVSLGLFLAILLNKKIKGLTFFRTIIFMPVVLSMTVTGLLWNFIFSPDVGMVNAFLRMLNLDFLIRDWVADPKTALISVSLVDIWKWTGFHMVIYLAGLETINPILYEASMIDGANAFNRFTKITIPLLSRFTFINLILCIMGGFSTFDLIYVMTKGGGPLHTTEVILTYMYKRAFRSLDVGYANAIIVILLLVVVLVTVLQFGFFKERTK